TEEQIADIFTKPLKTDVFHKLKEKVGIQTRAAMGTMDGIIDTVSVVHPIMPLIGLQKTYGKLVMVGAPEKPLELPRVSFAYG
ncbi:hypothetical protein RJ639_042633, partial [Escallonia herrerae]